MTSIFRFIARAIGVCAVSAALAACSGTQSSVGGSLIPNQDPVSGSAPAAHSTADRPWMATTAAAIKKLLYISDAGRNAVLVYDYALGRQVGMLTGFHNPAGQCVDRKGDVWIADLDARSLVEYPRGATTPIRTLGTTGRPFGCSVAPNGNLAAAENPGDEDAANAIAVWSAGPNGSTSAHAAVYVVPDCATLATPGYDNHGNLYLECSTADLTNIYEIRNGEHSMQRVVFNRSIALAGGVMWDGNHITLADRDFRLRGATVIYRAAESASGALALAGTTELSDACSGGSSDVLSPYIVGNANTPANDVQGTTVIGDNRSCGGAFDYWTYPKESNQVKSLPSAPAYATGASVSIL
jgi:hypothetical protein